MWAVKYFHFFSSLQSARIGKDLEHVYNFLISWIGSLCFFAFHILSYSLIISKFHFPGWPVSHLWVLLSTFEIFTYFAFLLYWRGLLQTVRDIRYGAFDIILTKPISSRFLTFLRNGGTHNLLSAVLGVIFLIYVLIHYHLHITIISAVVYCLALLLSLWILHCLSVLFICLNFFFGFLPFTSGVVFQIQEIYKYPVTLFGGANFFLKLFIIPLTALMSLPAAILLLKPLPYIFYIYYLGFAFVVTFASHYLWRYSLRHYSSAS